MLIFAGLDWDSAPKRSAKLKALKAYYHESDPRPWNMLGSTDLDPSNGNRGANLVINSHGNVQRFGGMEPGAFLAALQAKGFKKNSFQAVYLMACKAGEQDQENSIYESFAREFMRLVRGLDSGTKIYAPRGSLSYEMHEEGEPSARYWVVDDMFIRTPERRYPLNEGVLLVAQ
jgi:hypothetical protein